MSAATPARDFGQDDPNSELAAAPNNNMNGLTPLACQRRNLEECQSSLGLVSHVVALVTDVQRHVNNQWAKRKRPKSNNSYSYFVLLSDGSDTTMPLTFETTWTKAQEQEHPLHSQQHWYDTLQQALRTKCWVQFTHLESRTRGHVEKSRSLRSSRLQRRTVEDDPTCNALVLVPTPSSTLTLLGPEPPSTTPATTPRHKNHLSFQTQPSQESGDASQSTLQAPSSSGVVRAILWQVSVWTGSAVREVDNGRGEGHDFVPIISCETTSDGDEEKASSVQQLTDWFESLLALSPINAKDDDQILSRQMEVTLKELPEDDMEDADAFGTARIMNGGQLVEWLVGTDDGEDGSASSVKNTPSDNAQWRASMAARLLTGLCKEQIPLEWTLEAAGNETSQEDDGNSSYRVTHLSLPRLSQLPPN